MLISECFDAFTGKEDGALSGVCVMCLCVEQHRTDINHSVGQVEREEVKQGGSWEMCVGGQQLVWCSFIMQCVVGCVRSACVEQDITRSLTHGGLMSLFPSDRFPPVLR